MSSPNNVGRPKGPGLFMNEPRLSCHAEIHIYQLEISNSPFCFIKTKHTSKASALKYRNLSPLLPFLFGGPLKSFCQKTSPAKCRTGSCPWDWLQFSLSPLFWTTAPHTFTSTLQHSYACCVFGPCVSSNYLFFWDWWDGEGKGSAFLRSGETLYFYAAFWKATFWALPSITPYSWCVYVIKHEKFASMAVTFCQKSTFPRVGAYF